MHAGRLPAACSLAGVAVGGVDLKDCKVDGWFFTAVQWRVKPDELPAVALRGAVEMADGQGEGKGVTQAPELPPGSVHGLTPALTSFVGRAGEVAEAASLLRQYRLVTVTGPGGVGKTRLAGEVARQVAGRFADGVWLVELASIQDQALLQTAVATALGLRQVPGTSVLNSLVAMLARQQLLLVIDNCEHLVAAVAELCGTLLPAADDIRILATSREPDRDGRGGSLGCGRWRCPTPAIRMRSPHLRR
jgi:hypothetical protein